MSYGGSDHMGHCSYNTGLIEQSLPEGKGTLLTVPYAGLASSQYRLRYCVHNEQYAWWCRFAL
jgi:hypothetical protein